MSTQERDMSWLGSGLSQITGQISNFTKEVLTEGTEEVDDHATELRVAKRRLVDVEGQYNASRAELDRLKNVNEELADKLHTSELHTNALSSEYRQKLNEREREVQQLKQQHHSLLEAQSELAVASTTGSHLSAGPGALHSHAAFGGDEHDFDDVISGQQEINRLQREVERLSAECRHWRQVANAQRGTSQQADSDDGSSPDENVADLHSRIKDLERQLSSEVDDHQNELAALQNLHGGKLASQARKQAENQQRLQTKIDQLEDHILQMGSTENHLNPEDDDDQSAIEGNANSAWKTELLTSTPIRPLRDDHEYETMALSFSEVSQTNKHLSDEVKSLQKQVSMYQEEVSQFDLVRADLIMEKEALESVLVKLRGSLKAKEAQIVVQRAQQGVEEMAAQRHDVEDDDLSEDAQENPQPNSLNMDELFRQIELLTDGNSLLENERDNLQDEKEELQQKVSELESQVSKLFAADAKCLRLQAELDERTEELNRLQHEVVQQDDQLGHLTSNYDESFESIIEKEAEIAELEEKLQAMEHENELLLEERNRHLSDADFDDEIRQMREELREQKKEIEYLHDREEQLKYVTVELQERESSFRDLEEEKKILETSLDELDAQQQDAIAAVMQSKEKLAKTNEKLKQRNKELETEVASLPHSEDLVGEAAGLEKELTQAQEQVQLLEKEKERLTEEARDQKVKLEQGALALNNLQVDKRELEKVVKDLNQQLADLTTTMASISTEKGHLERSQNDLQVQLYQTHEKLQAASHQAQIQSGLQSDLLCLRNELDASHHKASEQTARVDSLKEDVARLQDQLSSSNHENSQLHGEMEELQDTKQAEIEALTKKISQLATQTSRLESELSQVPERLAEQAQRYEDYIREINKAKELDASSLEQNHRKLMEENHQKDMKISELDVNLERVKTETKDLQGQLQSAMEDQQEVTVLFSDKEAEVTVLQAQIEALQQYADEKLTALKALQTEPAQTIDASAAYSEAQEKLNELQKSIQELQEKSSSKDLIIEGLETDVLKLKQQLNAQTTSCENEQSEHGHETGTYTGKIQALETLLGSKERDLSEALDSLEAFKSQLNGHSPSDDIQENEEKLQRDNLEMVNNKDVILTEDRQGELRKLIQQKDDVIRELRNNNSSLLKLLEERSLQLHGNHSLVDMHKLQNELKGQQMEKEQIMSVLNDKTRECSNLKSEVHKLMNVISAEKSALSKLQEDNQELIKTQNSPKKEGSNADMTREAIKNLSMVIRDKDLEIESLQLKNQTLLQVMQQNPEAGAQMTTILQERENMIKQLEHYHKEREQIIVALNQKHQESVTYHNEIQRLVCVTTENNGKHEKLEQEFTSLQQQYEDKQQALLKLQNELLNYKQKFSEVDTKYKEILHRQAQQVQNKVQQGPPLPAALVSKVEESTDGKEPDTGMTDQTASVQYHHHITHLNNLVQQRKEEIVQLTDQVHQLRLGIQEKDRAITEHQRNLVVKEQVVKDKEAVINARNQAISEANARVREAHEQMRKKDMDMSTLRKQMDNMTFQARGLQTELNDLKLERDNALDRSEGVVSERTQLADANARLSAAIGERDLEMNAMREKVATLTAAVREACEKGEVEQMLADTEAMQKAAQVLQAERDQAYASLQAVQVDNTAIKQQASQLMEREQKLQRELDRLRSHLLTIEEGYTLEALAAEEREKELRNRLAAAEENIAHSSNAVQNYSVEANRQVESLQEQLTVIAEQRDHAMLQLSAASDTASQYAASLTNLQMVLEQFQKEREEQQSVETERYQCHLAERSRQLTVAQEQNRSLQARMDETTDALEAAQRLSEQLDHKEEVMAALKAEVLLREDELKRAESEIQRLTTSSEAKVDKLIIKNLILGYFHTPTNKRPEVLTLLGKVLGFSRDELQQVGANESNVGWLKGMFRRTVTPVPTSPATPNKASAFFSDRSFSEMFVKFLERESSPQPEMRLPAEAMAREQQEKQRQKPPAFNPFSVPASAPSSPGGNLSLSNAHILMKPMGGALPMFSPVMPTSVVSGMGTSGTPPTGRRSATSSGRSTPASVILKDVLQQQ